MTCEHCSDAEDFFDYKTAKKQLKKFKKSGTKGATKKILDLLSNEDFSGKNLLDIGGGIGAIQWHFLEKNGAKVTGVDASGAYLEAAGSYANENNWSDHANFVKGDFSEIAKNLQTHDFVTMDKVVCCYPDFRKLIDQATSKCDKQLALSYPIGGWIPNLMSICSTLYFKLRGSAFRPYIHPRKKLRESIASNGFVEATSAISFPWRIEVWKRVE